MPWPAAPGPWGTGVVGGLHAGAQSKTSGPSCLAERQGSAWPSPRGRPAEREPLSGLAPEGQTGAVSPPLPCPGQASEQLPLVQERLGLEHLSASVLPEDAAIPDATSSEQILPDFKVTHVSTGPGFPR